MLHGPMAPNTGPTKPALILLCTLGTLLLACSAPTGQLPSPDQLKLLSYLLESAKKLYEDYKNKENMQFPQISSCPTNHPLPSTHLDPGFFLPLIWAIKPIVNRTLPNRPEVDDIIEILQRLQVEDTTERPVMVTTPAYSFPAKRMVLRVLSSLSNCTQLSVYGLTGTPSEQASTDEALDSAGLWD